MTVKNDSDSPNDLGNTGEGMGEKHRMNPKSLENLQDPWKPGQSGNPLGRPIKNKNMIEGLRKLGKQDYKDLGGYEFGMAVRGKSFNDVVYYRIWQMACKGNIKAIQILAHFDVLEVPE